MHALLGTVQLAVGEHGELVPSSLPVPPPSSPPPLSTVFPLSAVSALPSLVPASPGPALPPLGLLELLHPTATTTAHMMNPLPTTLEIEIANCRI
jgi:hypothetical protein